MRLRVLITAYLAVSPFFLQAQFPSEKELAKHRIKKIVVWEYQCRHEPSQFDFINPARDTILDSCVNESLIIDKKGKKIERFARGNAGDTTMIIHKVFSYTKDGHLLQEKDFLGISQPDTVSYTKDYVLDKKGNISQIILCKFYPGGNTCDTSFYEYNKSSQLITIRKSSTDKFIYTGKDEYPTYFTYNKKGQLSSKFQAILGDTFFKIVNSYDRRGRLVEQIESDSWGKRKYKIIYNKTGKLIEERVENGSGEITLYSYTYGADGLLKTHKIKSSLKTEMDTLNYYYERD